MISRKFALPMASGHAVAMLPSPRNSHAMVYATRVARLHPQARRYARDNAGTSPATVKIISEVAPHRGRGAELGDVTALSGADSGIMNLSAVQALSIISVRTTQITGAATYEVRGGNVGLEAVLVNLIGGWNGTVFSSQISSSPPEWFSFRKIFNYYYFKAVSGAGMTAFSFRNVSPKRLTKGF